MSSLNAASQSSNSAAPISAVPASHAPSQTSDATSAPVSKTRTKSAKTKEIKADGRGSGRLTWVHPASNASANTADTETASNSRSLTLIVIGSPQSVSNSIKTLHYLRYANATDWSKFQRGPNPGEVMSVLTVREKRI